MKSPLKIGVCAVDTGSKNVCALVKNAADTHEFEIFDVPGLSVPTAAPVIQNVRESVAMLCGCSDKRPEATVTLNALKENPSLLPVFVEDFPDTAGHFLALPDMQELIREGVYACTILSDKNEELKKAGFRDVVTVGLPDHWTDSVWQMQQGRLDRADGKIYKQHDGRTTPITSNDILVYVVGLKNPSMETDVLRALYAHPVIDGKLVSVAFRAHPGENRYIGEKGFRQLLEVRNALLAGQDTITIPECPPEHLHDRMAGASDVVIINPGSTTQYPAMALQGGTMLLTTRVLVEDQEHNDRRSYATETSRMHVVERTEDLASAIASLINPDSMERASVLEHQKHDQLAINPAEKKFGLNVLNAIKRWAKP